MASILSRGRLVKAARKTVAGQDDLKHIYICDSKCVQSEPFKTASSVIHSSHIYVDFEAYPVNIYLIITTVGLKPKRLLLSGVGPYSV